MNVFSKARELADALLASEESLRLADARSSGVTDVELNAAANDFNALVNQALDIVRMSVGADAPYGNCGRSCMGG